MKHSVVENPILTDFLGYMRPECLAEIDASCPEQKLHRLLVVAENILMDHLQDGCDDTPLFRSLIFGIKHLFNIRLKLTDIKDRLRIRQERENERKAAKELREKERLEDKEKRRLEKQADKEARRKEREKAEWNAWRKKPHLPKDEDEDDLEDGVEDEDEETDTEEEPNADSPSPTEHLKLETSNSREAGTKNTGETGMES